MQALKIVLTLSRPFWPSGIAHFAYYLEVILFIIFIVYSVCIYYFMLLVCYSLVTLNHKRNSSPTYY